MPEGCQKDRRTQTYPVRAGADGGQRRECINSWSGSQTIAHPNRVESQYFGAFPQLVKNRRIRPARDDGFPGGKQNPKVWFRIVFQGLFFVPGVPSTPLRTCFARDSSYESLTSLLLLSRSADEARYVIFHHSLAALILDPLTVAHDTSASRRHYFCVENFDVDLNRIVHFDGAE
jgi:hypothetical protein